MSELQNGTRTLLHGLTVTHLRSDDGACAVVADHGAHLLSWCPAGGSESLFLSSASRYGDGQAIRGGVPVIFPQFGERGDGRRHGFARVLPWQFTGAALEDDAAVGRWQLQGMLAPQETSDASGRSDFQLVLELRLRGSGLQIGLHITNTAAVAWQCHAALHTYLQVGALETATVEGLHGAPFLDQTAAPPARTDLAVQAPMLLQFGTEVDRIYPGAPPVVLLHDAGRRLQVAQEGFSDTVVWNPGPDKAAALSDLEIGGHRHFVCIEAAAVIEPLQLSPGTTWCGRQHLQWL